MQKEYLTEFGQILYGLKSKASFQINDLEERGIVEFGDAGEIRKLSHDPQHAQVAENSEVDRLVTALAEHATVRLALRKRTIKGFIPASKRGKIDALDLILIESKIQQGMHSALEDDSQNN